MSRVLYLIGNGQLDFKDIFNYELAPVPTSMFEDSGEARYAKNKSGLMRKLKVEISSRGINADVIVIDGGGMLHAAVHWPKDGIVEDLLRSIENYVSKFISNADVYVIFDRYFPRSIKSDTRLQRVDGFRRVHHIGRNSPLPAKDMCMASTKTKTNLIQVINEYILEKFTGRRMKQKLVVTSSDVLPEETVHGLRRKRQDLETHYDEADYIIPQQVHGAIIRGKKSIKVISADTDVFKLLCHHYLKNNWCEAEVYLQNFQDDNGIISIKRTVEKHRPIIPSLVPLLAISGCDSVPGLYGIGKGKAISAINKMQLEAVGNISASKTDVLEEGKLFLAKLYGMSEPSSSKNRFVGLITGIHVNKLFANYLSMYTSLTRKKKY